MKIQPDLSLNFTFFCYENKTNSYADFSRICFLDENMIRKVTAINVVFADDLQEMPVKFYKLLDDIKLPKKFTYFIIYEVLPITKIDFI